MVFDERQKVKEWEEIRMTHTLVTYAAEQVLGSFSGVDRLE